MSGGDAAFLYDERPEEPQHTREVCFLSAGFEELRKVAALEATRVAD
jgi:hypothetical protein